MEVVIASSTPYTLTPEKILDIFNFGTQLFTAFFAVLYGLLAIIIILIIFKR